MVNLVKIICEDDCSLQEGCTVDILNEFPAGLDIPKPEAETEPGTCLPLVDIHTKLQARLQSSCYGAYFQSCLNGVGTIKDAIMSN